MAAAACGAPASAQAYVVNATVVPPGPFGFLTLWPQGATQPLVSTLNAIDGAITSNLAIVPTTNGSISIFGSNPTHVIMDISGYFPDPPLACRRHYSNTPGSAVAGAPHHNDIKPAQTLCRIRGAVQRQRTNNYVHLQHTTAGSNYFR